MSAILALCSSAAAKETPVRDVAEFDAAVKAARPGDEIVLADGEWRDADLVFRATGTKEQPIVLRARTPGKVVLLGTSRLRIAGEYLTARDLSWRDAAAQDDVVAFRYDAKTLANHCTLEACAILGDVSDKERKWVSLYGDGNAVRGCRFEGKQSRGTLLVVWLRDGENFGHWVYGNFFGPRERLGKNGGEIIRVGDSATSHLDGSSLVTKNYFYRCDGEAEIISNKSCDNVYMENTFVGCGGALTLRHGNKCLVSWNHFFGDGRKGTGGVRVIGDDHDVCANVFVELKGDDTRSALSLMNGLVDSPANGYFQVRRAVVRHNWFVDCKETIVVGNADEDQSKQTLPPVDCTFQENQVVVRDGPVFVVRTPPRNLQGEANRFAGGVLGLGAAPGWTQVARNDLKIETECVDQSARKFTLPADTGPAWMKPGDEYLPEVLKSKLTEDRAPK